jgi:hypothetical protein
MIMKKRIQFEAERDAIIFKDSESESSFYCMSADVLEEKMNIVEKYDKKEANVPPEITIKVSPVRKVGSKDSITDIYKPSVSELIDFPVNRIEWIWIQLQQS